MCHSTPSHTDHSVYAMTQQFNRAAASYRRSAQMQHRVREQLLNHLPQTIAGTWLDIGCGTGDAATRLRQQGANTYVGIDMAHAMLQQAQQCHQQSGLWIQADANQIPLAAEYSDGIVSSLMLQWSNDILHTLSEWRRVLKPRGELLFSTLLPGSMHELSHAHTALHRPDPINRFCTQAHILDALQQAGFQQHHARAVPFIEYYDSLTQLLGTLKNIGATHVQQTTHKGLRGRHWLQPLEQHYPRDAQQRYPLSYHVLFIHAQRASS